MKDKNMFKLVRRAFQLMIMVFLIGGFTLYMREGVNLITFLGIVIMVFGSYFWITQDDQKFIFN